MSAKSTVTQRRSSGSAEFCTRRDGGRAGAGPVAPSAAPHSMQNFWPGLYSVEHVGQRSSSATPHSMQNFAVAGFSAPQRLHEITTQIVTTAVLCLGDYCLAGAGFPGLARAPSQAA